MCFVHEGFNSATGCERVNAGGTITWKSYLMADGRIVAIRSTTGGVTAMRYVVTDHLNSVAVILDEKAVVIAGGRQSFDAWGLQRNADGTPDSTPCTLTQSSASTRGYTGQEEMAQACLVNFNARLYDPQLGRFLSADPTTEAPDDGQDWNRYSYVLNNPLAFTDPSGNSFLTDLFAAVISVAIIVLAPELIGPWATFADFMDAAASFNLSAIAVAAGSGAVAGAISAGITGGSVLKGALFGGISGALFAAVGAPLGRALSAADMLGNPLVGNFIAQGFVGGLNSTIEGGNFGSGFLAGGVGSLAGSWSGGPFDPGHMLASAIAGGAASVLGGGKFLNGAITSAFAYAATVKYGEETENLSGGNTPPSDASEIPGLTKQFMPYLHVEGNTLVGTATVQCQAGIDCSAIITDLSNINHQYTNGYKIDILFVSVSGQMSANIVVGYDMNNICIAAVACIGDYGHILLTSEY